MTPDTPYKISLARLNAKYARRDYLMLNAFMILVNVMALLLPEYPFKLFVAVSLLGIWMMALRTKRRTDQELREVEGDDTEEKAEKEGPSFETLLRKRFSPPLVYKHIGCKGYWDLEHNPQGMFRYVCWKCGRGKDSPFSQSGEEAKSVMYAIILTETKDPANATI